MNEPPNVTQLSLIPCSSHPTLYLEWYNEFTHVAQIQMIGQVVPFQLLRTPQLGPTLHARHHRTPRNLFDMVPLSTPLTPLHTPMFIEGTHPDVAIIAHRTLKYLSLGCRDLVVVVKMNAPSGKRFHLAFTETTLAVEMFVVRFTVMEIDHDKCIDDEKIVC